MKKKLVLLGLGGLLAISTVAASIAVFTKSKGGDSIRGSDVEYTLTVDADDVTTADAFESKDFTDHTDQLNNPVDFTVTDVKRNGDYFELKGANVDGGSFGNKDAIYAIRSVEFFFYEDNPATTMKIEWGWKVDESVEYLYSTNIYSTEPDGYVFVFNDDLPDYFRFVNNDYDGDALMVKKLIITYGDECETQTSYGNPYRVIEKLKYKRIGDHWVVKGYANGEDTVADLTFKPVIEGLPVTEIEHHAFYFENEVETVDFSGSNITTIGEYSFYVCGSLTSVNFNSSNVTTVNDYAFTSCSSLSTITGLQNIEVFENCCFAGVAITSVTLGDNLRRMSQSPFYGTNSITSVTFSDVCEPEYISAGAFNWCEGIEYVHIGSLMSQMPDFYMSPIKAYSVGDGSAYYKTDANGVLYYTYGESTYYLKRIPLGTELTNYVMPDYVVSTLSSFAEDCASLESVTLNDHITYISGDGFAGCTNLATINFGADSHVKQIYSSAFENCTSLTSIALPDSVTLIDADAFKNCTGLDSFTIPHNIGTIGAAFKGCSNIATIYYDGTVEEWETRSIYKYSEWYKGISATVLTCTDGTIPIEDAD